VSSTGATSTAATCMWPSAALLLLLQLLELFVALGNVLVVVRDEDEVSFFIEAPSRDAAAGGGETSQQTRA
jgi:hypothetical protein